MKAKREKAKLLWAFNPFQDRPAVLKNAYSFLCKVSSRSGLRPEPVYVVGPSEVNVVLEFSVPARERYRSVALAQGRKVLKKLGSDGEPTVLVEHSLSLNAAAKNLARYADASGAEAIVASVRAKKSLGQALIGSFADALLHQARCPVILVHPQRKISRPPARLLFLSDLSPASHHAFPDFCRFARRLGAEIRLFHSIPRPFSWASFAVDALFGPDRPSETQYMVHTRKLREADAKPFAETARRFGLKLPVSIAVGGLDVAADVLKEARRWKADLLGMAGLSGRLKTRVLGSVSKTLIGSASLPLWILHRS